MSLRSKWRLYLHPFELKGPEGQPVRFAYGKVESLLRILACRLEGVERDELGNSLWPESSPAQRRVNLRQALYQLRSILGQDSVVCDRTTCRLGENLDLAIEASAHEISEEEEQESPGFGPVSSFLELLSWYAEWDPGQMFDLLRSNRHLAYGVCPADANRIIDTAAKSLKLNHPLAAWMPFWRGYQLFNAHQLVEARRLFRHSVERGSNEADPILTVEGLYWMGVCDILLKRLDSATKLVDFGEGYVSALTDRKLKASVDNLRGHILIHQARTQEGIEVLTKVSQHLEDSILDRAQNEALIGLYHACAGQSKTALRVLEWPAMVGEDTNHFRLKCICELAFGYVAVKEGENDRALSLFDRLSERATAAESGHFQIYSHEGSAVSLWRLAERPDALKHMRSAKKIRKDMNMAYTDWDQMRIKPMLPVVRSA